MPTKFECEVMSWNLFSELSAKTAKKITASGYKPDFVVGLARGGWVLSRVLCDYLAVKDLVSLKVEHWGVTATPDGSAQIRYPFELDLTGRRVLIVDDITDTGDSMRVASDFVRTMNPETIRTATLRHIIGSKFVPDYYGDEISWRWVIFPWNYVEDMCNLASKAGIEDATAREASKRFKELFSIDVSESDSKMVLDEVRRRKG